MLPNNKSTAMLGLISFKLFAKAFLHILLIIHNILHLSDFELKLFEFIKSGLIDRTTVLNEKEFTRILFFQKEP